MQWGENIAGIINSRRGGHFKVISKNKIEFVIRLESQAKRPLQWLTFSCFCFFTKIKGILMKNKHNFQAKTEARIFISVNQTKLSELAREL